MNVLIVEDELLSRERLVEMLQKLDPNLNVMDEIDSVEETVSFFKKEPALDLAFFDIRLSDGLSFEIFNQVEVDFPVIFTTAYDDYALRAFKVNSVDYLLKPINFDELQNAINKFSKRHDYRNPKGLTIDAEALKGLIQGVSRSYKKRFIVKFGQHIQFKSAEEVSCFFADGKTTYMMVNNNDRKYIVDHTLEELENKLLDPEYFFRVNRTFIVRIDAIEDVKHYVNSRLKLKLNTPVKEDVVVSRGKVNEFKSWINQ